jgi:AcrR family transcriptional regulator
VSAVEPVRDVGLEVVDGGPDDGGPGDAGRRDGGTGAGADADLRAADGRVPGRRGRATRTKLLHQTAEMLRTTSFRELKVVDIARGSGTSPATFYQYFPDVEAAILVLAEEMAQEGMALSTYTREHPWKGRAAYDTAAGLVDRVLAFFDEHRSLLRVVDLATLEGDQRFRRVRTRFTNELCVALSEVIDARKREGRHPDDVDPMATAGVLVSMLGQVAAHVYGFEFWGIRTDDTRRSMTRVVYTTVTGQRPPTGT